MSGHEGLIAICLERIAEAEGSLTSLRTTLADLSAVGNSCNSSPTASIPSTKRQSFAFFQIRESVQLANRPRTRSTLDPLAVARNSSLCTAGTSQSSSAAALPEALPTLLGNDSGTNTSGKLDNVKATFADQAVLNPRPASVRSSRSKSHRGTGRVTHLPVQEDREIEYITSDVVVVDACSGVFKVPILHPESTFRLAWIVAGSLFIVYESFNLPYCIAFDDQPQGFFSTVEAVLRIYFLMDIFLNFFIGHMDTTGRVLITNLKTIAFKYARTSLLIDVLASIPWDLVAGQSQGQAFKGLRALKLLRLLRIIKLNSLGGDLWTLLDSHVVFMKCCHVMRLFGLVFALVHLLACLWYAVGANSDFDKSWVQSYLTANGYVDKTDHYIISFYFSLMTMTTVGFGDITPQNIYEIYTAVLLLLLSCIVFAGMTSTLTDIISSFRSHELMQKTQTDMLNRYMHWRAVPRKLKKRIQKHMLFLWDVNRGCDSLEDQIQENLPRVLREELCHHIYGALLHSAPFLSWMQDYPACIRYLSSMVSSRFFPEGDYIFRIGQHNVDVHLLVSGLVALTCNERLTDSPSLIPESGAVLQPARHRMTLITDIMKLGSRRVSTRDATVLHPILKYLSDSAARNDNIPRISTSSLQQKPVSVLEHARNQLCSRDAAAQRAARVVQRHWRRWRGDQMTRGRKRDSLNTWWKSGAPQRLSSQMPTMLVRPPTYLGESSLWTLSGQWTPEDAPVYRYAAKCRSSVEAVQIPVSSILTTLQNFSPWLMNRFDFFRGAVSKESGNFTQDQAEADMALRSEAFGDLIGSPSTRSSSRRTSMNSGWTR